MTSSGPAFPYALSGGPASLWQESMSKSWQVLWAAAVAIAISALALRGGYAQRDRRGALGRAFEGLKWVMAARGRRWAVGAVLLFLPWSGALRTVLLVLVIAARCFQVVDEEVAPQQHHQQ